MKTAVCFRTDDTDDATAAAGSVFGIRSGLPPLWKLKFFSISLDWIPLSEIRHTSGHWTKSKNNC